MNISHVLEMRTWGVKLRSFHMRYSFCVSKPKSSVLHRHDFFFFPDIATSQGFSRFFLSLAEDPIWHLPQRCGSTLKLRIAFTKAGRSLSLLLLFPEYRSSGAKLKRVLRSPAVKEKREAFLRIKVPAEVNTETNILGHLRLLGNPSLKLPFKRVSLQFLFFQNCVVIFLWSFC